MRNYEIALTIAWRRFVEIGNYILYIYNNVNKGEYIHIHLNYLAELLPPELIYYNPINTQWKFI